MKLDNLKKIHFIGIGGIGMSGLARFFLHEGKEVSGSDRVVSIITEALETEGVKFFSDQKPENVSEDIDLVVYTEAMSKDHPEMLAAKELNLPMMSYFEALGFVANQHYLIAVAGTHGKTTTTAMLIDIFEEAGLDPTAIVGSLRSKTGSNYRAGKSKYFIVEADEYRENFRHFQPDILVINNLDHDHVDYYPTLEDVQAAFHKLAEKVPEDGAVVTEVANKNILPVLEGLKAKVVDYRANVDLRLPMKQPGLHNRMNAAAAKAVAQFVGIKEGVIDEALSNFAGTWRRFEFKGEVNGSPVYDDYAHNPQKVAALIAGARELYPDRKINIIFQPHTYSRSKKLFVDFVGSLGQADRVILVPIYAAREVDDGSVSSEMLRDALDDKGIRAESVDSLEMAVELVKTSVDEEQVVLVVGAGDITKVADMLVK